MYNIQIILSAGNALTLKSKEKFIWEEELKKDFIEINDGKTEIYLQTKDIAVIKCQKESKIKGPPKIIT